VTLGWFDYWYDPAEEYRQAAGLCDDVIEIKKQIVSVGC